MRISDWSSDVCSSDLLRGREAERDIDHRAVAGERLAGLEPVDRQRHLDADIVGDLAEDFGLLHHRRVVERDDLGRDGAIDEGAVFLRHFLEVAARLGDQRRVGGDPVEQSSEEHTSELQSQMRLTYAVLCLIKYKQQPYEITSHKSK